MNCTIPLDNSFITYMIIKVCGHSEVFIVTQTFQNNDEYVPPSPSKLSDQLEVNH